MDPPNDLCKAGCHKSACVGKRVRARVRRPACAHTFACAWHCVSARALLANAWPDRTAAVLPCRHSRAALSPPVMPRHRTHLFFPPPPPFAPHPLRPRARHAGPQAQPLWRQRVGFKLFEVKGLGVIGEGMTRGPARSSSGPARGGRASRHHCDRQARPALLRCEPARRCGTGRGKAGGARPPVSAC